MDPEGDKNKTEKMNQIFDGVYKEGRNIATKNKFKGNTVYGEKIISEKGNEYRLWDPERSKLAAAIQNGLRNWTIKKDYNVLYLGASSGTTSSHVSDISNLVFAVEISKRMMRNLIQISEIRTNIIPVLADALKPETYMDRILSVDFIYQDVAQPNQAEILNKNVEIFKPKFAMLAIKARSIDVLKNPSQIFKREIAKLKNFEVLEIIKLYPYDKDHVLVNLRYKG